MVVIDVQRTPMQADETETALARGGPLDLGLGHAVAAFEVVSAYAAVFLGFDRRHCLVVTRLAVGGPPRWVRPVTAEVLERFDLRAARAVLHSVRNSRVATIGSRFLADRRLLLPVRGRVPDTEAFSAVQRQSIRGLFTAPELAGELQLPAVLAPLFVRI